MTQKTFEELKSIYLGNPNFKEEGLRLSAMPNGSGLIELQEKIKEYYRQNGFESFAERVRNENITFNVKPINGDAYTVEGVDSSVTTTFFSRESQKREAARTGVVPDPTAALDEGDPGDKSPILESDDMVSPEDRSVTGVLRRTENLVYLSVVDKFGEVVAFEDIEKEDWNSQSLVDAMMAENGLLFVLDANGYTFDQMKLREQLGERDYPEVVAFEDIQLEAGAQIEQAPNPDDIDSSAPPVRLSFNLFPMLPTSDVDVERFKQEMSDKGLLFGDGIVQGIPPEPELVLDEVVELQTELREELDAPVEESRVQEKAQTANDSAVVKPPSKVKPGSQPAIMLEGLARDIEPNVGKGPNTGLADRPLPEPVPFYNKCSADKVMNGKNNTWIVFGRDRPGGFSTGYGPGQGHTQAGAIDICVGRMSPKPLSFDKRGNKIEVGPLFTPVKYSYDNGETLTVMDAARIYISQKTDIDENFDLQTPPKTKPSRAIAGIAMKADGIRIMSRKDGIRLVTEDANSINSKGGSDSSEPLGICLIAANKAKELQPMIKGDNLTHLLAEMLANQAAIAGAIASIKQDMIEMNCALLTHEHVTATAGPTVKFPALTVKAMEKVIKQVSVDTFTAFALQNNPETIEKTYLEDGGKVSIKSKYNKVN